MTPSRVLAGPRVARDARLWARGLGPRVALVSEPRAFALFGREVRAALKRAGREVSVHLLPRGEKAKAWDEIRALAAGLLRAGLGRDSGVAALGGGAVTDAAGFTAAIFMRGIPWVSMPTTLLGQLDGGIGGKTAVNLPQGKNLVGAFHQPVRVVCDTDFLRELPARERLSGLAEALKIGLTFDRGLWGFLTRNWDRLMAGDPRLLAQSIRRAAAWKLRVVGQDERETSGRRELLNFGHTLGHALEAVAGYGVLRHGEAVIWGMRAALRLSLRSGLSPREYAEAEDFLAKLPVPLPGRLNAARLLAVARKDKKARAGRVRFILLKGIGRPIAREGISEAGILRAIGELSP